MVDQTKEVWCSLGKESTEDIYPENLEGCVQSVATFVFWKGTERSVQFGMCCFCLCIQMEMPGMQPHGCNWGASELAMSWGMVSRQGVKRVSKGREGDLRRAKRSQNSILRLPPTMGTSSTP